MKYTCPKCGKNMDLSVEALINNGYKVICPQCLSRLQIIGDTAFISNDDRYTGDMPGDDMQFPNYDTTIDVTAEEVTELPPPVHESRPRARKGSSDPLYHEALRYLMSCQFITIDMLCSHFNISKERAEHLMGQLEANGAVGPYNGYQRRIMIPHQSVFETPRPFTGQSSGPTQVPTGPKSSRSGCYLWVFLFILFIIMQTCVF